MIKFIETTGRSEEDAISAALFQLGLERDDVSVEVVERAKSGFLGFGGNPAKVRVSYEVADEETEAPAPVETKTPPTAAKPAPEQKKVTPVEKTAPKAEEVKPSAAPAASVQSGDDEKAQKIEQFLVGLLRHMNVNAAPKITKTEEGNYNVVLEGQGLGAVIGRRGETLDAIQQLTNYSVNRGQSKRVRIHIDAENYRAKREEALERLAVKVAGKVIKYRKSITLESMNAYERHVIHAALQEYPGVTTYSTGVEPNRRTVVALAPK